MKNDGMITLAHVPTDVEGAKLLKEKIESHRVTLHPDWVEKILERIDLVIAGRYEEKVGDGLFDGSFAAFEESRANALLRESKRNSMREQIKAVVNALRLAESEAVLQNLKYEYQCEIAVAKLSLLKVMAGLESESNQVRERILIPEF